MRVLVLLLLFCGVAMADPFTIANTDGESGFHVWLRNGDSSIVYQKVSQQVILALAQKGAVGPTRGGHTWLRSEYGVAYDNPDGRLRRRQASVRADGVDAVLEDGNVVFLPGAQVVGGIVVSTRTYAHVEILPDGDIRKKVVTNGPAVRGSK